MIPTTPNFSYVKKSDIPKVLKANFFTMPGIIMIVSGITFGVMVYFIIPRLNGMYESLNVEIPYIQQLFVKYWYLISIILAAFGVLTLKKEPSEEKIRQVMEMFPDKGDEDLVSLPMSLFMKSQGLVLLILGLMVGLLIVSIISPIYKVTSSL